MCKGFLIFLATLVLALPLGGDLDRQQARLQPAQDIRRPVNVHAFVEKFGQHLLHNNRPAVFSQQGLKIDATRVHAMTQDAKHFRHLSKTPTNLTGIGHRDAQQLLNKQVLGSFLQLEYNKRWQLSKKN